MSLLPAQPELSGMLSSHVSYSGCAGVNGALFLAVYLGISKVLCRPTARMLIPPASLISLQTGRQNPLREAPKAEVRVTWQQSF